MGSLAHAELADGSYEGNVSPEQASPGWLAGTYTGKEPSLLEWVEVKDGVLCQKAGAPEYACMRLDAAPYTYLHPFYPPITGKSYTVEVRFRVTACPAGKNHTVPLTFLIRKGGAALHSISAGWGYGAKWPNGYLGSTVIVNLENSGDKKKEWNDVVKDERIISGEWLTLRVTTRDGDANQSIVVSLDGKPFQEITTADRWISRDYFFVTSRAANDGWEIDYIRWINEALDIETPLERAITPEEKQEKAALVKARKVQALRADRKRREAEDEKLLEELRKRLGRD